MKLLHSLWHGLAETAGGCGEGAVVGAEHYHYPPFHRSQLPHNQHNCTTSNTQNTQHTQMHKTQMHNMIITIHS